MTSPPALAVIDLLDAVGLPDVGERVGTATPDEVARMNRDECLALLVAQFPALAAAVTSVVAILEDQGMCLLRGVPTTADLVLALTATAVGELVPATERPVSYIEDIAPAEGVEFSRRPHSQRRSALMPHTDQSARGMPPDFLVLACLTNEADRGGESVLVPAEPVVDHLRAADPNAVELLQDSVFPLFNVPKRDFAVTAPLLQFDEPRPVSPHTPTVRTRFRDEAVRAGLAEMNRPSEAHVAAFEALSAAYHDERWWVVRRLEPGDVMFFDNTRVLHGRKAVLGDHRRHLKRLNGRYWKPRVAQTSHQLSSGGDR